MKARDTTLGLEKAHEDNIGAMKTYSTWEGKTAVERELIAAIRVSVQRSQDALAHRFPYDRYFAPASGE